MQLTAQVNQFDFFFEELGDPEPLAPFPLVHVGQCTLRDLRPAVANRKWSKRTHLQTGSPKRPFRC